MNNFHHRLTRLESGLLLSSGRFSSLSLGPTSTLYCILTRPLDIGRDFEGNRISATGFLAKLFKSSRMLSKMSHSVKLKRRLYGELFYTHCDPRVYSFWSTASSSVLIQFVLAKFQILFYAVASPTSSGCFFFMCLVRKCFSLYFFPHNLRSNNPRDRCPPEICLSSFDLIPNLFSRRDCRNVLHLWNDMPEYAHSGVLPV